jgi:hypothetical protein
MSKSGDKNQVKETVTGGSVSCLHETQRSLYTSIPNRGERNLVGGRDFEEIEESCTVWPLQRRE